MLPEHLLLRVVSPTTSQLANWPAYKFGIETMLRARGLEGHIDISPSIGPRGRIHLPTRVNRDMEQWEAEEELCRAIIGFNVKDFTEIFREWRLVENSVRDTWRWLTNLSKAYT